MRRVPLVAGLLAAGATAFVIGCSEVAINDSPNGPTCKAAAFLLAFFNSTVKCTTTAATTNATNSADVTISGSSANLRLSAGGVDSLITVAVVLHHSGTTLQAGTWDAATSGMTGTITITNGSGIFTTTANSGANDGTFTLHITKSSVLTNTANGTAYLIDGTLDATVPAVTSTGASGTATLHIDFTNN